MLQNRQRILMGNNMDRTYCIMKRKDRPEWGEIPVLDVDKVLWTEDAGIRAYGQLYADDEYLYVHMKAVESEIRAEYTDPLSPVFLDSCMEFFFSVDTGKTYFNFEINPNGCITVQFGPSPKDRIYIVRENDRDYYDIHTNRTADGWEAFYRIPCSFIRLFHPGYEFAGSIEMNMYKCGDRTPRRHYLSWAPVHSETPNFHRPQDFQKACFV